jgi:hypothetical protein
VIRSGVDTLEHTFSGELSADIGEQLDRLKLLAQDTETPQPIWFEGREFFVQERSIRHYRWHLSNSWVLLHLRRGQFGPSMKCKLTARGLAEGGVEEYWDEVVAVAHSLGFAPLNLCRLDLAVDFQGWGPTFDEMRNVRCRSTHRPVIPNVDHPETFYFGKSPKMVRVYNKTVEIEKKHKEWWRTVWRSTGLYTEREPVWRCELELGSEILKELGCRSVGVALEQLGSIYAWGLEEVSLGAPNGDTNVRASAMLSRSHASENSHTFSTTTAPCSVMSAPLRVSRPLLGSVTTPRLHRCSSRAGRCTLTPERRPSPGWLRSSAGA